ncbi:MAG: hybrid sensor histidine kinase/response regulator [Nocardioides sp.]|nr:hybrid sensor histidine kinase/response regulator [Nocardioides sp.]
MRTVAAALWTLTAVLVLGHLAQPAGVLGDTTYLLGAGLAPVVAWLGTLRARRGRRLVPVLIAAGLTASALGDLIWYIYYWAGNEPDVSIADIPYFLSYVGLGAAILVITLVRHDGTARIDADAVIDALTVVVVSVLVIWSLSVHDIVADDSVSAFTRLVWAAYPVADAVLLALVLRALSVRRTREALGVTFAVGVACWLVSDLGYLLLTVSGTVSAVLDVGWIVGGVLMATSTWRGQAPPEPETQAELDARAPLGKLGIAILPLLVPPALLLAADLSGSPVRPVEAVVGMVLLAAIAFTRTARLLRSEGRSRAELAASRDAALEGSRAKSAFLATMSHEIRTPMNGVIGLTGLLLTSDLDQRQRQYAEGVRSAGNALLAIINDILDFSKVEAGRLELESIDFDLVRVVEEVAEIVAESAQEKDLELLAYCSPELPVALRGDPARLRQLLINLTANAVKFTAEGEVVVRAHLEARAPSGVVVRFEVQDTGIGIATDDRARMFEPFSQADSSTTRRYGGTGLGLAICQQLVTAMGGTIGVESSLGAGSTFWVTAPFGLAEDTTTAPPRRPDELTGLRVLVVDDNQTNRMILHDQLEAWGLSVALTDSGATALTMMAAAGRAGRAFDLAVLDLCMPDMDGLDLARRISADAGLATTGLVLLTSGPDIGDAQARAAGISASLTKPVQLSRLQATLQGVVGNARQAVRPPVAASPTRRGRVLVVEDGEINQLVAAGILEHLGYRVDVVDGGVEALAAMRDATFDAVLMDVHMPGMDGYQATAEIRRIEGDARRTPIIAMTAGAVVGDAERCLAAGMDDYLSKPIDVAAVDAALGRWVPAP